MIFTVLRVSGSDFLVDTFLDARRVDLSSVWHRGESSRRGSHQTSGFTVALPDAASWKVALPAIRAFLNSERKLLEDLRKLDVDTVLDIGVTVGEEESYAPSLQFPKDALEQLAALGV